MLFKAVLGTDVQFLAIPSCHLRGGGLAACVFCILRRTEGGTHPWDMPTGYIHWKLLNHLQKRPGKGKNHIAESKDLISG